MSSLDSQTRRLTLAVLLDHLNFFGRGYEGQLRDALHAAASAKGHTLLFVYGGPLAAPNPLEAADNALYDLIRNNQLDGIVAVSSILSAYCGTAKVGRLLEQYRPTHMCSIGAAFPGIPGLLLDNSYGIEQLAAHLLRDHGRRRFAFLGGTPENPDSQERFAAFRGFLEQHGVGFDPRLFVHGNFLPAEGRAATEELLARGIPFDALVSANDSMALGAIQALRRHGRRVPQDVAVTGFDNLTMARLTNPPLTTVAQPFDIFAHLAIDSIECQVAGRTVPPVAYVPSHMVRRQSCGCGYHAHAESSDTLPMLTMAIGTLLPERILALRPILADILSSAGVDGDTAAARLIEGLQAEAAGTEEAFCGAVGDVLTEVADDGDRRRSLQSAINRLRNELADQTSLRLERAFYDGLSLVALTNTTGQLQHRLALEENYVRLITVGEHASAAFDLASLRESLARGLPAAGVRTALVSCLSETDPTRAEVVVCIVDGETKASDGGMFPASWLLPPGILPPERASSLLVFPLTHEQRLLGVIAFDHLDGNNAYVAFRNQIAAVLNSIRLHQEVVRKTMQHERTLQERIATTKRMEALSVLAGGVAHDLNNALGPLVVLPDVILDELARLPVEGATIAELKSDVEDIKTASLRAAQTIKDLLTLGRQGRTAKSEVDINRLVRSCLAEGAWKQAAGVDTRIRVRFQLASEPLIIRGAETQLARAISNLVRNAVEAIDGQGDVDVRTAYLALDEALAGFETIPPGAYALLAIADTGCGISEQNLHRVFEPFFSTKAAGERSGTGLGLAIVHGVVKEHGGYLDVTSTRGVGTTFSLYFPAGPAQPATEPHRVRAPRGSARILVVDDEGAQLRTCRRVLTRLGYSVETSTSGAQACEIFREALPGTRSPFDVVLVDMMLGEGMDGLQVVDRIHGMFPEQKAIIVSGHAPNDRADLAIAQGLVWLLKPYDIETLAQAVATLLHG